MKMTRRVAIGSGLGVCLAAQSTVAPSTTLKVGDKAPDCAAVTRAAELVQMAD